MPSDSNELLLRWKTQIERELKIGSWTELFKSDPDGIEIQPVYTQSIANTYNLPAFNNTDCEIVYRLNEYKSTQEANALYLKALSSGATALWYHLKQNNLDALFEHIETPYLLNILEGTATELFEAGAYLKRQMPQLPSVWAMLTPTETPNSWKDQYQTFVFKFQKELPAFSPMVSTELYHARGASPAFEMAIGLSMLLEFFSELFSNIQEIVLHAAVSELFFNQLVKFRALHRIWNLWKNTHPELPNLKLSASNSLRFYSASDPDSNLLRSATAALSAKLGGVSALH